MALDLVDQIGRHAALAQGFEEAFRILDHEPRTAAHRIVGTDQIRLPGLTHPLLFPIETAREDLVEIVDRELQDEDSGHLRTVENRTDGEAHGASEIRAVGFEVGDLEIIAVLVLPHGPHLGAELGVGVGAVLQTGAELGGLFVAVNDVERIGVDQHHVLEAEDLHRAGEKLMQHGMRLSVGGDVARSFVQLLLLAVVVRICHGVVVLQVTLGGAVQQVLFEHRSSGHVFVQFRNEIVAVKSIELGTLLGRERGRAEFFVRGTECAHAFDNRLAVGNGNHLVAQGLEHGLERGCFGHAHALQPVTRRLHERFARRPVTDPRHDGNRGETHCQKQEDHLRLDTEAVQTEHGGASFLSVGTGETRRKGTAEGAEDAESAERTQEQ